ncbi:hypothetical protein [Limosilactobacillus sp.]|uniref:hypothetical protein n=1 Tax=Limosilactobacillus sp. TaxID=2773925 RepID=UPI0035A1C2B9
MLTDAGIDPDATYSDLSAWMDDLAKLKKAGVTPLAVAQACNMGCGYCYAHGGDFGKPSRAMPWETARAAIDSLIDGANGDRANSKI